MQEQPENRTKFSWVWPASTVDVDTGVAVVAGSLGLPSARESSYLQEGLRSHKLVRHPSARTNHSTWTFHSIVELKS